MPYTHHQMHEYGAHIGDVMLFPTRAFALGSGGTSLGGHRSSDQLVRHNFKGTVSERYFALRSKPTLLPCWWALKSALCAVLFYAVAVAPCCVCRSVCCTVTGCAMDSGRKAVRCTFP